jgi:hypothetical protein
MIIRDNERSWVIELISKINLFLNNYNMRIKRANGEKTISTNSEVMFPDIILYGDKKRREVLQGWEVKMPDIEITNQAFINDAERKARNLNLSSFVIWNFSYGVLYKRNKKNEFVKERTWSAAKHIKTREDVETYEKEWSKLIKKIIIELNDFFEYKILLPVNLENLISNQIMQKIISKNKVSTASYLENQSKKSLKMRNRINLWWEDLKEEYTMGTENKFEAFSKRLLLDWLNKILFCHMIKRTHSIAKSIEDLNFDSNVQKAIEIFSNITSESDFYNIFKKNEYLSFITKAAWNDIISFSKFLESNYIIEFDPSFLQNVLENTINTSKRLLNGQYTTPKKLAKLLVRLSLDDLTGDCLDPCCGTGTIPKEIINHKLNNGINPANALQKTWASDKFSFALQISNLNMITKDTINIPAKIF